MEKKNLGYRILYWLSGTNISNQQMETLYKKVYSKYKKIIGMFDVNFVNSIEEKLKVLWKNINKQGVFNYEAAEGVINNFIVAIESNVQNWQNEVSNNRLKEELAKFIKDAVKRKEELKKKYSTNFFYKFGSELITEINAANDSLEEIKQKISNNENFEGDILDLQKICNSKLDELEELLNNKYKEIEIEISKKVDALISKLPEEFKLKLINLKKKPLDEETVKIIDKLNEIITKDYDDISREEFVALINELFSYRNIDDFDTEFVLSKIRNQKSQKLVRQQKMAQLQTITQQCQEEINSLYRTASAFIDGLNTPEIINNKFHIEKDKYIYKITTGEISSIDELKQLIIKELFSKIKKNLKEKFDLNNPDLYINNISFNNMMTIVEIFLGECKENLLNDNKFILPSLDEMVETIETLAKEFDEYDNIPKVKREKFINDLLQVCEYSDIEKMLDRFAELILSSSVDIKFLDEIGLVLQKNETLDDAKKTKLLEYIEEIKLILECTYKSFEDYPVCPILSKTAIKKIEDELSISNSKSVCNCLLYIRVLSQMIHQPEQVERFKMVKIISTKNTAIPGYECFPGQNGGRDADRFYVEIKGGYFVKDIIINHGTTSSYNSEYKSISDNKSIVKDMSISNQVQILFKYLELVNVSYGKNWLSDEEYNSHIKIIKRMCLILESRINKGVFSSEIKEEMQKVIEKIKSLIFDERVIECAENIARRGGV